MREDILLGYTLKTAAVPAQPQEWTAPADWKTPKGWKPHILPNKQFPFGATRHGRAYRDPSNPAYLTQSGVPKTRRGAANRAAGRQYQDTASGNYGISKRDIAMAPVDAVVDEAAGVTGKFIDKSLAPVKHMADQYMAKGDAKINKLKGQIDRAEKLKASMGNMPAEMWKRYGGKLLAGGAGVMGLWAIINAMSRQGQAMSPAQYQQMMRLQQRQARPLPQQQIFRNV